MRDRLVTVLQGKRIGLDTIAMIADLIADDARFNAAVARAKEKRTLGENVFALVDLYEEITDKCEVAINVFATDDNEAKLREALLEIRARLEKTRRSYM